MTWKGSLMKFFESSRLLLSLYRTCLVGLPFSTLDLRLGLMGSPLTSTDFLLLALADPLLQVSKDHSLESTVTTHQRRMEAEVVEHVTRVFRLY